jgi:YfiH family protein
MRFADCVPILLYDPGRRVVGLVHAGWKGTVARIASAAVQAMRDQWGTQPDEIQAGIGPSIGAHHYSVGPDVITEVEKAFGQDANSLLPAQDGGVQFDLWAANRLVLEQGGVRDIETAGLCTACDLSSWFSHRAEPGGTGRFGAIIALDHEHHSF